MKERDSMITAQRISIGVASLFLYVSMYAFVPNDFYVPWLDYAQQLAMNTPPSFGKTHFVIGYQPSASAHTQKAENKQDHAGLSPVPPVVFFTPDHDVRSQLISLINQEQENIKIAVFLFTDKKIADALLAANRRGVHIEIVTDPAGLRDRANKIGVMCDNTIAVYVYHGHYAPSGSSSIMHHKFIIFSKNKEDRSLLWTGSFNFTRIACDCNQENVIVLYDKRVIEQYEDQFKKLKQRSYKYSANADQKMKPKKEA
jgi:phosphatidylserine/phosphatidylglycerophosphate/cardiolipin synthase-like enzyme